MQIAVVGGGPAGITAAQMLCRYGCQVTLFEKGAIGGLIRNGWSIENIAGRIPCSGVELARSLRRCLLNLPVKTIYEEVLSASNDGSIKTRSGEYSFDRIVLAVGTEPVRIMDFEVSEKVVYYYNDIPDHAMNIAVYGAGDAALDGALHAITQGRNVLLFSRSEKIKAIDILKNKINDYQLENHFGEAILHVYDQLDNIRIETNKGEYPVDLLLLCIGRRPENPLLQAVDSKTVFAIGDAVTSPWRQVTIAMGNAMQTVMKMLEG